MLTAVWFILVAIAIPCQAYLDDRVLLDQHWTGFSPTAGVGVRRDACEARSCGSARRHDHEPDKRSVGFALLRDAEDKPQMVRGVRSATRRSQESYLRFRRESARDVSERSSVRHVLVNLERLSRRERIEGATRRAESAVLLQSSGSDLRREERESRDQSTRLDVTHEERSDRYARRRTDIPRWVNEDSRRRIRPANRNLVRSDDRRTSDRVRRYEGETRNSRGRQANDPTARQRWGDVQALSLTQFSRLTETPTKHRQTNTRFHAQSVEGETDLIRATRSDTSRSGPSRLQVNGKTNRDRHLQDAINQNHLIMGHLSDLIGLEEGLSLSTKGPNLRKAKSSERRHSDEGKSDAMAFMESTSTREATLARQPFGDDQQALTVSTFPQGEKTLLRTSHSISSSSSNSRDGGDMGNQVRHTVHAERSISEYPVSLKDGNRDARRFSAGRRYIISAVRSQDTGAARSSVGRSDRHAGNHDSYSPSFRRLQGPEPKETVQDRRDYRRFSSRTDELQPGDIPNRRRYTGSSRIEEARFPDATRRRRVRNGQSFDWANKEWNSIQVSTRSQVRSDDTRRNSMALSHRSRDSHVWTRTVEYPVEITRHGDSRLLRGGSFTRQDRTSEDRGRQLILSAWHTTNCLRNDVDRCNLLPHMDDSRGIMAADSRHREGRLSSAERQGMPNIHRDFRLEETRKSIRVRTSRTAITDDSVTGATRSTRNSRNDPARSSFRLIQEDTQISLSRLERYPTKFSEKRQGSSGKISNNQRDLPNMPLLKTESSSLGDGLGKILPEEGSDKYKEKMSYYRKHQKEDLSWDKVMSRSGSSLLQTILTVGMVAWMTTPPSKSLVD